MSAPKPDGPLGFWRPETTNDEFNSLYFFVQSMLKQINVATLVKVQAVHTEGRAAAVGTVDVVPLVNLIDGLGQSWQHTIIYGLPFFRLQGGVAGVICDPVVGDVGIAVFCDKDISAAKNSAAAAPPGSQRRFSYSDGLYFGAWSSKVAPTKAVILDSTGCEITCDTKVDGNVNVTGIYEVGGTQVVKARQPNIAAPSGGAPVDSAARATIVQILSLLQAHGLME